jgi:hypothetical protein
VGRAGEATDRAVVGDGERGGEQGVSGVDADLHGLLGADELEQHVEELPLVRRRGHQVPAAQAAQSASSLRPDPRRTEGRCYEGKGKKARVPRVLGGDLPELLHALRLPRVHARLQDVLRAHSPKINSPIRVGPDPRNARGPETPYLVEVVALEQALVADLGVARLLLAAAVGLLLRLRCRGRHCQQLPDAVVSCYCLEEPTWIWLLRWSSKLGVLKRPRLSGGWVI